MPIFTFVNKCDRAGEDPLKLISDVEADLDIGCYPVTWPIYRDSAFAGVYDRRRELVEMFERGLDHGAKMTKAQSSDLHDPALIEMLREDAHHRCRRSRSSTPRDTSSTTRRCSRTICHRYSSAARSLISASSVPHRVPRSHARAVAARVTRIRWRRFAAWVN